MPFEIISQTDPIEVRFIEEMPFNGTDRTPDLEWDHNKILNTLKSEYPDLKSLESSPNGTSMRFKVPDHKGKLGIIPAFSRTFCGTCNRIRVC